jgi:hypothetical protein
MNNLLIPYIVNILILIPVSLGSYFNSQKVPAIRPRFKESAGYRTISGSVWLAILFLSVLGLFFPVKLSPVLLVQVVYKVLWLLVFFIPRIGDSTRRSEIDWSLTGVFILLAIAYPFFIPWQYLFT